VASVEETEQEEKKATEKKKRRKKRLGGHHKPKTLDDDVLDKSVILGKTTSGAEAFYNFYRKEPHRKFAHGSKQLHMAIISYLMTHLRTYWSEDHVNQMWDVRTCIQVLSYPFQMYSQLGIDRTFRP
jgi:hypothetical protein